MAFGDRRGPGGFGPGTGRGMGYCNGYDMPGYMNNGFGRGFGHGFGRGFGRGFGSGYRGSNYGNYPNIQPVDEKEYISNEINILEKNLEAMKKRLEQLGKEK